MKWSLFSLIFLFSCSVFVSKNSGDKENVKQAILTMFALVDEGNSIGLADYIVYRGENESRKWKDHCRYTNPDEKHLVQNLHQKIVDRYLPYKYEFVEFTTQIESEGKWLVWQMNFMTGEEKPKKVYFAFLKVNGKYFLGDID